MKKMILMAVMLINMAAMAQEPVITFEKTTHDFGKIDESERVSTVFEFKNEGTAPLLLTDVKASNWHITFKWPSEPIEPGQVGQIKVTYNDKSTDTIDMTNENVKATGFNNSNNTFISPREIFPVS